MRRDEGMIGTEGHWFSQIQIQKYKYKIIRKYTNTKIQHHLYRRSDGMRRDEAMIGTEGHWATPCKCSSDPQCAPKIPVFDC